MLIDKRAHPLASYSVVLSSHRMALQRFWRPRSVALDISTYAAADLSFPARARVQRAYSGSPHFSHLLSNSPLSLGPLGYTGRKTCAQQTWHGGGGSAALPSVDGLRRARISSTSLARRLLMVRIAVSSWRAGEAFPPAPQCAALGSSSHRAVLGSKFREVALLHGSEAGRAGACSLQAASRCASLTSPITFVLRVAQRIHTDLHRYLCALHARLWHAWLQ